MTTPREKATKVDTKTETKAQDSSKQQQMTPAEAATLELHSPGEVPMAALLGDDVFERWADEVRSNPAYQLRDPDDPDKEGATNSSGSQPPPALIVEYGPGQHQYISTVFDAGQAIVQDGSDPTGKAWKFPEANWRRFVARVRGDEVEEDPEQDGPTMHEAAAKLNERTAAAVQADREATPDDRANERSK